MALIPSVPLLRIPLLPGIVCVAFDDRKQGWHDKLAGTVVIRPRNRPPRPVVFEGDLTPLPAVIIPTAAGTAGCSR